MFLEGAGFDVMVTTDQNIKYQQNLIGRKLHWSSTAPTVGLLCIPEIVDAVDAARPNSYAYVEVPLPPKREYNRS